MAVYKIFPEESATLYSFYPLTNTGLDEIIEISTFESINSTNEVSRGIIKFPTDQITDVITNKVGNKAFDTYLKLYLANASSIPVNYTLYAYPISGSWEKGTGRLANVPATSDGAMWSYRNQDSGSVWFSGQNFPSNPGGSTTGSYRSGSTSGGGLWYTGSYATSQSFTPITSKDIEIKTTFIVNKWYSGSLVNQGFIIKNSDSIEFTTSSKFELKYFSENTHTIYPPCLEIRWNDTVYITGSLPIMNSNLYTISLGNNKDKYQQDSIQRFKINVRPQYPPRTYSTSSFSFNLVNYALPSSSYWSLKDLDTEEIIIDYDDNYTKISCDGTSSYFDLYINGLEPERYYKLLIKTIVGGNTIVLDNNYYFKVIR